MGDPDGVYQSVQGAGVSSGLLPVLIAKALSDTGYDLVSATDDGWFLAAVSGTSARVGIKPATNGTLLAIPESGIAAKLGLSVAEISPPKDMYDVGRVDNAMQLYESLRVLHSLQTHHVSLLSSRVEVRLAAIPETERTSEVRRRIGQDVFRDALMDMWQGRCAVTGLAFPPKLLRASHAKPWAKATDSERLDPFNGLLLSIHLDAMFDAGLIAFSDDGVLLCSRRLHVSIRQHYSISDSVRLRTLSPGHIPYLAWHRTYIFEEITQNHL